MNRLADVFKSITIDDGSPDYDARKSELSSLIRHLTETEIQDLRAQLNSRIISNDPCIRFPIEIVQEIAKYLDLEEVIRGRHVSKSWLGVLGGDEISQKLLKWHFPRIWERKIKHVIRKKQTCDEENPQKVLLAQAEKLMRRNKGLYFSTATYRLPTRIHSMKYCNGRVAFVEGSGESLHVWNLRTNHRLMYKDKNRQKLYGFKLSESLLVYESRNRMIITVKNLDVPDSVEPINFRLPSRICEFWAQGDQVGIVLQVNYEVLIWKWGGPLRQVDTYGLTSMIESPFIVEEDDLDLFFHPYNVNKIFIVANKHTSHAPGMRQIIISEGLLVKSKWEWEVLYKETYPPPDCPHTAHRPHITRCHGNEIGILKVSRSDSTSDREWWHVCSRTMSDQIECEYATFNMLTGKVEASNFRFPHWYEKQFYSFIEDAMLFRGDQVLLPVQKAEVTGHENSGAGIVALKSLPDSSAQFSNTTKQTPGSESANAEEPIYSWTGGTFIPEPNTDPQFEETVFEAPAEVKGDYDFVLLLGKDDFVVWCFDETVALPQFSTAED